MVSVSDQDDGVSERGAGLGSRFWSLWAVFTATNLGDGLSLVAFPLLAISLTDDARLIALVSVFRFLPFLVVGLPAGVMLDRTDRRRAAVLAQLGRASVLGVLSVVVLSGRASILWLSAAAFAVGVGEVVTDGGLPALVRDLVASHQLEVANSRLSATQTVSNLFIGPPLGALLFELEPGLPFVVITVLFVVGAGLLVRLPGQYRPEPGDDAGEPLSQQILVGLRYVWGHPVLRPLALTVLLWAFVGEAGNAVFVILATERFGLSNVEYGFLVTVDGIASIITSFFIAWFVRRTSHASVMRFSVVAYTLASLCFGLGTAPAVIVLGAVIGGIAHPTWNVNSATIRQRLVPDHVFGRMMTAYLFIAWSMQPLGALLGGVIAERWGPEWVFVLSAVAVGSLLVLARPLFRAIADGMASTGTP